MLSLFDFKKSLSLTQIKDSLNFRSFPSIKRHLDPLESSEILKANRIGKEKVFTLTQSGEIIKSFIKFRDL